MRTIKSISGPTHVVEITETQRQMILLALAELSIDRPGWLNALEETALTMDCADPQTREPTMFGNFRRCHAIPMLEVMHNGL